MVTQALHQRSRYRGLVPHDQSTVFIALCEHNGTASMLSALQDLGFSFQDGGGCPFRLTGLPGHSDREASLQWVIRANAMDE